MLPQPVPVCCMRQRLPNHEASAAQYQNFHGKEGDRRQRIVLIGTNMDKAYISGALNECVCASDELQAYYSSWAGEHACSTARPGANQT